MDHREGMAHARKAAWSQLGKRHYKWFVFGPLIVKAVGVLVCVVGIAGGIGFVASNYDIIVDFVVQRLVPIAVIFVSLSFIGIAAFVFWRVWGWQLELRGINSRIYASVCMSSVLVILLAIGLMV